MSFRKITDPAIATSRRRQRPAKVSAWDQMKGKFKPGQIKSIEGEAGKPLSEMSDEEVKALILNICREKGWQV